MNFGARPLLVSVSETNHNTLIGLFSSLKMQERSKNDPVVPMAMWTDALDFSVEENVSVVNVVVTVKILGYKPLLSTACSPGAARFLPDRRLKFMGLEGTCLVFRSGRGVIVGLSGVDVLPLFLANVQAVLAQECGEFYTLTPPCIQNIVVSTTLPNRLRDPNVKTVDLHKLARCCPEMVTYIPEQFPGARITLIKNSKSISINLFQSGKYILPGIKNLMDVKVTNALFLDFYSTYLSKTK